MGERERERYIEIHRERQRGAQREGTIFKNRE